MNAQQLNAWIDNAGGLQLWESLYADYGLVPMCGGNTGVQMGGWFNREINTIDDFKGLKMRMPGLGGKVLKRAGGSPVLLAGSELYTGLEKGTIDATEWIGPIMIIRWAFIKSPSIIIRLVGTKRERPWKLLLIKKEWRNCQQIYKLSYGRPPLE